MLRIKGLTKTFGPQTILEDSNLVIHPGEKVSLIGPNGTGKTTLFRMIEAREPFDEGDLIVRERARIGVLRQELASSDLSLIQTVLHGDEELIALRQQRDQLQTNMNHAVAGTETSQLAEAWGVVDHRLEEIGGYEAESRAGALLLGLGFENGDLDRPLGDFSGGWRMRVALAQLLFSRADLMLLDEPTNHLDIESIQWFENYIGRLPGTLIIISHDRDFLNRVSQVTVEMEQGALTRYVGTFDDYVVQKADMLSRLEKEAVKQSKRIEALDQFIRRFRAKATKARQVQSRVKQLAKIDQIKMPQSSQEIARIRLPEPPACARETMALRQVGHAFDDHTVFSGVHLSMERGQKIGLLGPNGAGKTTLLKLLSGQLEPSEGQIIRGDRVKVAYFAQHALEALKPEQTVLESAGELADRRINETALRSVLGGFLFSGETVFKQVSVLSGGEKARLALARLFLSGANVLLLDEPTNHLDMASRAALEEGLADYAGTLILVSHDRALQENVCTGHWLIGDKKIVEMDGTLDDYLEQVAGKRDPVRSNTASETNAPAKMRDTTDRRDRKRQEAKIRNQLHQQTRSLRKKLSKLESDINSLEEQKNSLDEQLADTTLYESENKIQLSELLDKNRIIEQSLNVKMEQWEEITLAIETHEQEAQEARQALEE
ncbi:MAG: ABC-F family ATP-binding cassette domain-containing protein [Magnetococcales bacterium]|nr:ABC-F family ATP-binding cassette domain-containing protein [Magnetococcales bacterium]